MKLTAAQAGVTVGSAWINEHSREVEVWEVSDDMVSFAFEPEDSDELTLVRFLTEYSPIDPEAHVRAIRAAAIEACAPWVDDSDEREEMRKAVLP